jgi:hypothetical protein
MKIWSGPFHQQNGYNEVELHNFSVPAGTLWPAMRLREGVAVISACLERGDKN